MAESTFRPSPFFEPGPASTSNSLALLHLRRDQLLPLVLRSSTDNADGYAEGAVVNTRFGSFPHTTLVDVPWGSQVLASKVDTGSRGRKGKGEVKVNTGVAAVVANGKRKREETGSEDNNSSNSTQLKTAVQAGTGFLHLLPPTPESWTVSLPHRTQVVYTPDYSYILQRLQVRPGQTLIEAGGGSGSFTHAAARAVFRGHPSDPQYQQARKKHKFGHVCTFEYHEPRANQIRDEIKDHGLTDVVTVTHRDVYEGGFLLENRTSPKANAVFLDLPAPWMALKNLTRQKITSKTARIVANSAASDPGDISNQDVDTAAATDSQDTFVSPLDPNSPIHLCTFSPCIEQVTATAAALRRLGWTDIEMVEVMHKRIDVRRERIGLKEEGLRGVNASAASVDEAVNRLRDVEGRFKEWHDQNKAGADDGDQQQQQQQPQQPPASTFMSKQERLERIKQELESRKTYKEGKLVHRTEPDIKTHTSYLMFAVLPREWSEEQEQACRQKWPIDHKITFDVDTGKKEKKKKKQ